MELRVKYYIFEIHADKVDGEGGPILTNKVARLKLGHPDYFNSEEEAIAAIESLPGGYLEFVIQKTYSRQRQF